MEEERNTKLIRIIRYHKLNHEVPLYLCAKHILEEEMKDPDYKEDHFLILCSTLKGYIENDLIRILKDN